VRSESILVDGVQIGDKMQWQSSSKKWGANNSIQIYLWC